MSAGGKRRRRRARINAAGRTDTDVQYVNVRYALLRSTAWRTLAPAAQAVFWEVHLRFHGGNNGRIPFSVRDGAAALGMGKTTVARALKQLCAHGFLECTCSGHWYGRLAATWRLTTKPCDGHPPTEEWRGISRVLDTERNAQREMEL